MKRGGVRRHARRDGTAPESIADRIARRHHFQLAPSERSGEDSRSDQDRCAPVAIVARFLLEKKLEVDARTATARCSITRWLMFAAASNQ